MKVNYWQQGERNMSEFRISNKNKHSECVMVSEHLSNCKERAHAKTKQQGVRLNFSSGTFTVKIKPGDIVHTSSTSTLVPVLVWKILCLKTQLYHSLSSSTGRRGEIYMSEVFIPGYIFALFNWRTDTSFYQFSSKNSTQVYFMYVSGERTQLQTYTRVTGL